MNHQSLTLNRDSQSEELNRLYTVVKGHIPKVVFERKNRNNSWLHGYNDQYDVVILSKTGRIGEIYLINGVYIALPDVPKNCHSRSTKSSEQYWQREDIPKQLGRIQSIFQWHEMPKEFKAQYVDYIEKEFDRRDQGHWFMNNGTPTYMTGSHYMYLQWSKIDVGYPDFREANRIFFIYWESCKADYRSFGMVYLKIRRSGFSFMSSSECVNIATLAKDSRVGILSKTGSDAKKMFTDKVVPINSNLPFFFKPVMDGMDKPKTELAYRVPASKITKKNMHEIDEDGVDGLDTTIDWKNTDENSYDGEKLLFLAHDECYDPNTKILMSDFTFKEIKDIDVSLTGDGDRFIPAFPASTHYSSSPVDSRLGELARGLGVSTGTHQDQASSKFERIEPFEEMSHSSIHDYTFSVEDLADLSYASRARMMTHGRWPGVKASIVTDPNEESFV
mgnify:CR=1 FL=1